MGVHHRTRLPDVQDDAGGLVVHPAADSEVRRSDLAQDVPQGDRVEVEQLLRVVRHAEFGDEQVRELLGPPGRDATSGPAGEPGQAPVQAIGGGGAEQTEGGVGTGTVTVDRDLVGIAAEVGDVPLDPGQRGDHVLQERLLASASRPPYCESESAPRAPSR